jgi:poly(ADP-ribose) glycohydrolase ARH3
MMTTVSEPASHDDRCIGCLLGTACGDSLGAAVEGQPADTIRGHHGELRDFQDTIRGFGCYTDDTEMTLALATSLVEKGIAAPDDISLKYAEFYEPRRGYGAAAHRVMGALLNGADYRKTGRMQFPDGSFGNGGAMRIAPVGLAYRHAADDVLRQAVEAALLCTHVHPEAIDGAFIQAKAVAMLATTSPGGLDRRRLVETLTGQSKTFVVKRKLEILLELGEDVSDDDVIYTVGNGIRTSEAVAASLWAFLRYGDRPEDCLVRAVNFGGDTDTIGAMVGAQVGSLYGSKWIPSRWISNIENKRHGRDHMVGLARELARLDISG